MDPYEQLLELVQAQRDDYQKAKGGNKAAGTRVRSAMQDAKNLCQQIRQDILSARGGGETKPEAAQG